MALHIGVCSKVDEMNSGQKKKVDEMTNFKQSEGDKMPGKRLNFCSNV